jgi:hypothetical protein
MTITVLTSSTGGDRGTAPQVLIQSDRARIAIHLSPGTYSLSVSAQAGVGAYRLTTTFTPSTIAHYGMH